jgi:hypothetical protein
MTHLLSVVVYMVIAVYDRQFNYIIFQPGEPPRPLIPIRVTYGGQSTERLAIVDSGADLPLFPKTLARILGINLTRLPIGPSEGTSGEVDTWYCQCGITVEGITRQCRVGIVDNDRCPYLLGRDPFFKLLQIGFRESLEEFYFALSP